MFAPLQELMGIFAPEGVWAVLSLVLIAYILRRQEKRDERQNLREEKRDNLQGIRDKKHQESIAKLANAFEELEEIKRILSETLR